MMKSKLDAIETRLQSLFENRFSIFGGQKRPPAHLARQLTNAIEDIFVRTQTGQTSPERLYLYLNPVEAEQWKRQSGWQDWFHQAITDSVEKTGLHFTHPPQIEILSDPSLSGEDIRVVPWYAENNITDTAVMHAFRPAGVPSTEAVPPARSFLILNGQNVYPLTTGVFNIGRREDNHLILDDPRISRTHAQIRITRNQVILCDLNSTGGTFINGERITQRALKPGDVISLAGLTLIYGEESTSTPPQTGRDTSEIISKP